MLRRPLLTPNKIVKQIRKATGIQLSDYIIRSIKTIQDLRNALRVTPPPKKLATQLVDKDSSLSMLPNVNIKQKRVSMIDKENAIGRWKVIAKELEERGLPVTGRGSSVKRTLVF